MTEQRLRLPELPNLPRTKENTPTKLTVMAELPAPVAALPAPALACELGGPTLFDLRKEGEPPLFISVLLHGNEVSGWDAVRRLAPRIREASALLFVGNVAAASAGLRTLPERVDFNRVWEGGRTAEAVLANVVVDIVAAAKPRLAVDVHNNTGRNPPYAVACRTDSRTLALAGTFSPRVLLATQPHGFQTRRLARVCTAVTVEVGTPDDPSSTARATAFLAKVLAATPTRMPASLSLLETVARVTLDEHAAIVQEAQEFNFRTAPPGTMLASGGALSAWDEDGRDVSANYLVVKDGATMLKRPTALAMYTGDIHAARQDCLCYLLKALPLHA